MNVIETSVADCFVLEPKKFGDNRGYFSPYYISANNDKLGFQGVVQANRSLSSKGILRGLHIQQDPKCQTKIVECLSGAVLDVVVDIREDSPTYKKWYSTILTPENGRQLLVPRGFLHGFVSLEDNTLFHYLVDNDYAPELEQAVLWSDPEIGIDWQLEKYGIEEPSLSDKDKVAPTLKLLNPSFKRGK